MKTDKKRLLAALALVSGYTDKKSPNTSYKTLRLASTGSLLVVSGQDGLRSATVTIPCDGRIDVGVGVDRIVSIVGAIAGLEVEISESRSGVVISGGGSSFSIPTIPVQDLAGIKTAPPSANVCRLPSEALRTALDRVYHALCLDETRPIAKAKISFDGTTLTATSTDGHRMAIATSECEVKRADLLIPSNAVSGLISALKSGSVEIDLTTVQGYQWYSTTTEHGSITVGLSETDGSFPDISAFKRPSAVVAKVVTKQLIEAVSAASLADSKVTLRIEKSAISIQSNGTVGEAQTWCGCESTGKTTVALNAKYLLEALGEQDPDCELSLTASENNLDPVWISSKNLQCIVMPMRS